MKRELCSQINTIKMINTFEFIHFKVFILCDHYRHKYFKYESEKIKVDEFLSHYFKRMTCAIPFDISRNIIFISQSESRFNFDMELVA